MIVHKAPPRDCNRRGHDPRSEPLSIEDPNPAGRCMCGCGGTTTVVRRTNRTLGLVAGHHRRYLKGHQNRSGPDYIAEDRGYDTPCWIWNLHTPPSGHGQIEDRGRTRGAHVVYYERAYGPVPAGMQVHHKCEQPSCVNPDHVEPLTPADHRRAHSRLTLTDVRHIRARVAAGEMHRVVAVDYGVTRQTIGDIATHRRWREAA